MAREQVFLDGCLQDADGTMIAHMHPEGASFPVGIGNQKDGEPCEWCERDVPLYGAIRRTIEGDRVTITDAETGQVIAVAEV